MAPSILGRQRCDFETTGLRPKDHSHIAGQLVDTIALPPVASKPHATAGHQQAVTLTRMVPSNFYRTVRLLILATWL